MRACAVPCVDFLKFFVLRLPGVGVVWCLGAHQQFPTEIYWTSLSEVSTGFSNPLSPSLSLSFNYVFQTEMMIQF